MGSEPARLDDAVDFPEQILDSSHDVNPFAKMHFDAMPVTFTLKDMFRFRVANDAANVNFVFAAG